MNSSGINRRQFLQNVTLATTAILVGGCARADTPRAVAQDAAMPGKTAKRPNILLILSDDQGYGDMSCYGNADVSTPHQDALAASGVRCTDLYAWPVCTPFG